MAHYSTTVPSSLTRDEAFSYMSDFRNVTDWDPSIEQIDLLAGTPTDVGARYRVKMKSTELEYEVTEVVPGQKVVLRGENGWVVSIDEIAVSPSSGDLADVTYDARLSLKGPLKLADPVLALVFKRLGDKARDGLISKIGRG